MKILVNSKYGGYTISDSVMHELGYDEPGREYIEIKYGDNHYSRCDPGIIEYFETYPEALGDLIIKEIPDSATDWSIFDYDGMETLFYVVNGRIYTA